MNLDCPLFEWLSVDYSSPVGSIVVMSDPKKISTTPPQVVETRKPDVVIDNLRLAELVAIVRQNEGVF